MVKIIMRIFAAAAAAADDDNNDDNWQLTMMVMMTLMIPKGGVTAEQFRTFFPAMGTGKYLSDMVFRFIYHFWLQ